MTKVKNYHIDPLGVIQPCPSSAALLN